MYPVPRGAPKYDHTPRVICNGVPARNFPVRAAWPGLQYPTALLLLGKPLRRVKDFARGSIFHIKIHGVPTIFPDQIMNQFFTCQWRDGDRLLLDLTHGLRDMPATVLGMAMFLRYARRDVSISLMVYGFENRDAGKGALVDLTPTRDLLAWADATDVFNRGANPGPLATLFKSQADEALQRLGEAFESLTLSLLTFRLGTLREQAEAIAQHIRQVKGTTEGARIVPGLASVLDLLLKTIEALLQDDELNNETLLTWFYAREALFPYVSLRRENIIREGARAVGLHDLVASAGRMATVQRYGEMLHKAVLDRGRTNFTPDYNPRKFDLDTVLEPLLTKLDHKALALRLYQSYSEEHWKLSDTLELFRNHLMHAGDSPETCPAKLPKFRKYQAEIRDDARTHYAL